MTSTALISTDKVYRYNLTRTLAGSGPPVLFGMLNPSTADASLDDPTIRRCIGFANRENASWMGVINTHGLRATDPRQLRAHPDPIGPENDIAIHNMAQLVYSEGGMFLAAWGAHPLAARRAAKMLELIAPLRAYCLGTTASGAPSHPLYIKRDQPLIPFTVDIPGQPV